jgi:anaerobic selenocysteine-containing dehydrogenase
MEGDRIVGARGDKSNEASRGYICVKGLHLHDAHYSLERLLHPMKRQPDGSFKPIALDTALDEIAAKIKTIMARDGGEAIGAFRGTNAYLNMPAFHMQPAWLAALESNSFFSTMTIDQSGKWVAFERLGGWAAGTQPFLQADVQMFVGINPLVSLCIAGYPIQHPLFEMKAAKERGMKIVVIDPRKTETARYADVHLQLLPGEDVTVIAGLLRIIFMESWHDIEFCNRYVKDLNRLMQAVEHYTPDYVARRAGIDARDLYAAAKIFAEPICDAKGVLRHKRGSVASGTGTNMGPHSNLAEHLAQCLNVVCGRYARAGDEVPNPGVVAPRVERTASVIPPQRSYERGWKSRVGGYGMIFGEKMSGVLAQEITTPGQGQIKALFVQGGNPVVAMPDQNRVIDAFRQLELLVTIDPFMTHTGRLSHYVIPPKMMYERMDLSPRDLEAYIVARPFAHFSPPVIEPPEGSEVVDDWYVYWALAKRLGKTIVLNGVAIDMETAPTTEEILALLTRNSAVPFDEIKTSSEGRYFEVPPMKVQPGSANDAARFDVAPPDIEREMAEVLQQAQRDKHFTHRLSVRRLRDVQNATYQHLPAIRKLMPYNPAYIHPDDLAGKGIASGDRISITSQHGRIDAIAKADATMLPGTVAIAHGWGQMPGEAADPTKGSNVNLLTSAEHGLQSINAMATMTGVPVNIQAAA